MDPADLVPRAAAPWDGILTHLDAPALRAPTPCSGYDVHGLLNHLLFWGPSLEAAARKGSVAPPAQGEGDVDLVPGVPDDAAASVQEHVERTVAAWSRPQAWEGTTRMGPSELPAPLVGGMVLGELVVHGWDLARATGASPAWDDDVLARVLDEVARSAEQGRELGVYGPEVGVPASAPLLERVLGLTGRDPQWRPAEEPAGGR